MAHGFHDNRREPNRNASMRADLLIVGHLAQLAEQTYLHQLGDPISSYLKTGPT